MIHRQLRLLLAGSLGLLAPFGSARVGAQPPPAVEPAAAPALPSPLRAEPPRPQLAMTPAVACSRVDGLDQFTPLAEATLTPADKLKLYFRPQHYKVDVDPTKKAAYRVKFSEDGRIRRKGEKNPIAKEDKLLEYEERFEGIDPQVYLVNLIGLESLKPGDYEFDITLHDLVDGQATARQTVSFRIVPGPAEPPVPPEAAPAPPAGAKKNPARSKRPSKRPG